MYTQSFHTETEILKSSNLKCRRSENPQNVTWESEVSFRGFRNPQGPTQVPTPRISQKSTFWGFFFRMERVTVDSNVRILDNSNVCSKHKKASLRYCTLHYSIMRSDRLYLRTETVWSVVYGTFGTGVKNKNVWPTGESNSSPSDLESDALPIAPAGHVSRTNQREHGPTFRQNFKGSLETCNFNYSILGQNCIFFYTRANSTSSPPRSNAKTMYAIWDRFH